ncbi:lysozyme inhibitor LprI family protein [Rhodanobacter ginsengisoli]|uniref:Lysozyme inhibitor LprI family protein n=1 Tax=Rhodanobacter ginsengisoli TaxID=418646 RepID=A0ABW0QLB8_9GAMM
MKRLPLLLSIVAITPPSIAHADDCAHATTQAAMTLCADQAYRNADAEMNVVYRQVLGRLKGDKDGTQLLVTAQRRWLAFRDAECARSTSASAQGSIHSMLLSQCRADLTRKRIGELEAYRQCQQGDLSCQVLGP